MQERFEIMEKAIETMLADKKYATLRDILVTMNPADIAAIFSSVEESGLPLLFRLLPKELAAETFVEMEPEDQSSDKAKHLQANPSAEAPVHTSPPR